MKPKKQISRINVHRIKNNAQGISKKKKKGIMLKKKKMLKDYESKITYLIFCPCKKGHTHILIPCVRSLKIFPV